MSLDTAIELLELIWLALVTVAVMMTALVLNQVRREQMVQKNDFDGLRQEFDVETTRLSNKIDELIGKIQAGGMTAEEEAQVLADFTAVRDRLRVLGSDPQNPVPAEPTA